MTQPAAGDAQRMAELFGSSGLLTSTLLGLLVIPVVFTYVDDVLQWLARVFRAHGAQVAHPRPRPRTEAAAHEGIL